MTTMLTARILKLHALEVGFDLVGIAPPSALKDLTFLPRWIERGFGGDMHYLENPKREDPRRVLPSVKSIICAALIYNTPLPYSTEVLNPPFRSENGSAGRRAATINTRSRGWISRYAWGKDYHEVMRRMLKRLRKAIETLAPNAETRVFVDTGPIVERAFARLTGIGWMGKNTCVINEQKGSWFFLGLILTNLDLEVDFPAPDRCGSCTRCLDACPTGALVEPYVMDGSRCISYFNIELRGAIPAEFRTSIGQNIFGCDICQDVCPWNRRPQPLANALQHDDLSDDLSQDVPLGARFHSQACAATTAVPEFHPLRVEADSESPSLPGNPESVPDAQRPGSPAFSLFHPPLEDLAAITEEDFPRIFAHSPIKRAKYRGWLRTLCVVMGNSGDGRFIPWLKAAADSPDPMVREHAHWALKKLQQEIR